MKVDRLRELLKQRLKMSEACLGACGELGQVGSWCRMTGNAFFKPSGDLRIQRAVILPGGLLDLFAQTGAHAQTERINVPDVVVIHSCTV